MKKLGILFAACIFTSTLVYGQTECSKFYVTEEGARFEITMYDHKEKAQGTMVYNVKEDNGDHAVYSMEMKDKKGTEINTAEYSITCDEDGVSIDFSSMMSGNMAPGMGDMEVDISGTNIFLPNDLNVGQELPDAEMQISITGSPIPMSSFVKMVNRKVEGKESITTPAGTFECYVLSYDTEVKMGVKRIGKSKQWLAEGIGMVKSEDYNKKGKLTGSSVLTAYSK